MGRKISWCSGCYDEIELVYNKVIQNPAAASLLSEFEKRAFQEAEENCMMINRGNVPITREVFLAMSEAVYYDENVPLFRKNGYRKSGTMILRVRSRDTALN